MKTRPDTPKSGLQELQHQALVIANHYDDINRKAGRKTWDLNDYMDGFVGDIGDLMKAIMGARDRRAMPGAMAKVEHELADALFSVLILYKCFKIDPEQSFKKEMAVLEKRLLAIKETVK